MRRAVVVLVILFIVLGGVAVTSLYLAKDNVTVSGRAGVTFVPATIIQTIEFTDTQTGTSTAYQFNQNFSGAGTYSVTLKNGHSYNVYISFYVINPENSQTHFTTMFYVNATAGQTVVTKNFWYPDHT